MSIIQLTSLDWSWEERFSMVGHSFRVMAMAKNYDEMVVGMMHAIYAGSDYTRFLYRVDVDGDPEWKAALDLFVPPLKMKRPKSKYEVPSEDLLGTNMPQSLLEDEKARQDWMIGETLWSASYEKYIWKIRENRVARNVMIHKLLDMLDVLRNPGKYEDESGPQYYVLPWKKHWMIDIRGRETRVPRTDDKYLLREPTAIERAYLIGKYEQALELLVDEEVRFPVQDRFSEEEHREHEQECHSWFLSWMAGEKAEMERYGETEEEYESDGEDESEGLPF
jgi:hypothetical protein